MTAAGYADALEFDESACFSGRDLSTIQLLVGAYLGDAANIFLIRLIEGFEMIPDIKKLLFKTVF